MNYAAYIERRKYIIREHGKGQTVYAENGREYYLSQTEKLFAELTSLKGLNTAERLSACGKQKLGA